MSQLAPNWFVTEYRTNVRHKFQSKGFMLKNMVTPEGRIEGLTVKWPVAGKVEASPLVRGSNATPVNPSRDFVSADLQDWQVFDEIQFADLNKMTVNERNVSQESGAMALGRKSDKNIIAALDAGAADTANGGTTLGNGGADFGLAVLLNGQQTLVGPNEVQWDGQIFAAIPAKWWAILLTYKQFQSSDWVGPDIPFGKGSIAKTWNGINVCVFPDSYFGSGGANQIYGYMWHRSAIGYASNFDTQTFIEWDNRATCWTVNMLQQNVSKAILPPGILRFNYLSNTTISVTG